jgi:23S rRNA pseudouridine1911/1915/1917 synthase
MEIKILYEDKNILAIDKPSGISVHPDGKSSEETISDWAVKNYPEMENVGELLGEVKRPGIVHRLDKETSGVLLLAKNQQAHQFLKSQFQNHEIKKVYHAIVFGWLKNDSGTVDEPIGRSPTDFRRRLSGRGARGEMREAVTEYKVLERFEHDGNKFTYLEVMPKTGRTHQIRVHMKFLNTPVVCDKLYAPKNACPKELDRLALHAKSIEFKDMKGELIKVEAPDPVGFAFVGSL